MTNLAKIKRLYLWKPSICKTFWTTLVDSLYMLKILPILKYDCYACLLVKPVLNKRLFELEKNK